ncbi:MAG: hypothetical protein IKD58_02360 [Loktanella sp.]|nr:hypothetical protein [Loktanella sp.]
MAGHFQHSPAEGLQAMDAFWVGIGPAQRPNLQRVSRSIQSNLHGLDAVNARKRHLGTVWAGLQPYGDTREACCARRMALPVVHPQLSEIYWRKVEELSQTLADLEIRPAALDTIRGLIQSVTIHETADGMRIDLDGAITALVGLAQPGAEAVFAIGSVKVVAGGRNLRNLPDLRCSI